MHLVLPNIYFPVYLEFVWLPLQNEMGKWVISEIMQIMPACNEDISFDVNTSTTKIDGHLNLTNTF